MRLRSHILSVVTPLIVAPIAILGWIALEQLRDNAKERLLTQLVSETHKIGQQGELAIKSIEKDLEILSTFSVVQRYLLSDDEESRYTVILPSLLKLFRTFQETHSNYYEIKVLWTDGYEDARSALPGIDNVTDEEDETAIFQTLKKPNIENITRFFSNPDTNAYALVAGKTMALIDRTKDPISSPPVVRGHLIITSDTSPFVSMAKSTRVGDTGIFFLVDEYGNIIFHPNEEYIERKIPNNLIRFLNSNNEDATHTLTQFNEQEVYLTHTTLRNKLHIFGQLNAKEVLASGHDLTQAVLIIIIVSVVITTMLVYLALKRTLITPIRQLNEAVNDMQYGEFQRKINIRTNNELGQLARTFETMGEELQTSHDRIHALAYYDELTKLPNRSMFKNELQRTLSYCQRRQLSFALMFIDIDNFKHVNDVFGHQAGDKLLMTVSERLKQSLRGEDLLARTLEETEQSSSDDTDVVARLGGDEFIVLLPNLPHPMAAHNIAQRIIDNVSQPIVIHKEEVFVSASIGIALYPDDGETPESLLRNADLAMYHAKSSGKNQLQFYGDAINLATTAKHNLEARLRKAIQNNVLEIYYQPILALDGEELIGAEALLRWNDEELGFVPPDQFISVAEDSGIIIQLGEWVLRNACQQNKRWNETGLQNLTISVNVSGVQITRGDLNTIVEDVLSSTGINPNLLSLEVTETSVVSAIERANKVLTAIRHSGVKIALDDFGTGYSSLSYLRKLPIDHLKIDRSFIADISEDKEDETIISAIIAMGKNLEIEIIAEGIETSDQLNFLRQRHCEMGQGYLFSKPLPAKEFERFARKLKTRHFVDT